MNEKELPQGCGLAIEVVCVCLALGVSFRNAFIYLSLLKELVVF